MGNSMQATWLQAQRIDSRNQSIRCQFQPLILPVPLFTPPPFPSHDHQLLHFPMLFRLQLLRLYPLNLVSSGLIVRDCLNRDWIWKSSSTLPKFCPNCSGLHPRSVPELWGSCGTAAWPFLRGLLRAAGRHPWQKGQQSWASWARWDKVSNTRISPHRWQKCQWFTR